MADEDFEDMNEISADVPEAPAPRAAPKPAPKAKPKPAPKKVAVKAPAKRKVHKKVEARPSRSVRSIPPNVAVIAVYVVLGLLVIGTSFYAGLLYGRGGSTAKTGSAINGKLQIIEYSDYQCPFCGQVEPTVEKLRADYGDKIEFVYKNFPLDSIHPFAHNAAIAAECARDQGDAQFWKYHDYLFQHQDAIDVPQLKAYAQTLGLDTAKFNDCLDNKKTDARVQADQQEGLAAGVQGTPSFLIGGELFVGAQPYDAFKAKIDAKLSGAPAAPSAPTPSAPSPAAPPAKVDVAIGNHVVGNANAKVTVVEFSDYQCPFCKAFYTDTEGQIMDQYVKTGKVKFAYRNFPLPFHQNAEISAEAAECVAKIAGNDAYWKYHDTLFTKGNGDGTGLDAASLKAYAAAQGIDATKFNSCLDNGDTKAVVQKDTSDGTAAGVQGTPSFYINGVQLVGAQPFSSFKSAIDAALSS